MQLIGLDAANVNTDATFNADLPGASFVIHKATEGLTFTDADYAPRIAAARAAHKLIGSYHFGRPSQGWLAQAAHYLAVAKPQPGDLVVHDIETTDAAVAAGAPRHQFRLDGVGRPPQMDAVSLARTTPTAWASIAAGCATFGDAVLAATGADTVLYSYPAFLTPMMAAATSTVRARLLAMPLWIADPNHSAGSPIKTAWPTWFMQQFGTRGGLDADILNGDATLWAARAVGGTAPTPPSPTPIAEDDTMYIGRNTGGVDQWSIDGNTRAHIPDTATLGQLITKYPNLNVSPAFLAGLPIVGGAGSSLTLPEAKEKFEAELASLGTTERLSLGYDPDDEHVARLLTDKE